MSSLTSGLNLEFAEATYHLSSPSEKRAAQVTILANSPRAAPTRPARKAMVVPTRNGGHIVLRGVMGVFASQSGEYITQPTEVAVKLVVGRERIKMLQREAKLYEYDLREMQGTRVPRYYGIFMGAIEGVGGPVAALVLEWCGGEEAKDPFELNRQRMSLAAYLHKSGVRHNQPLDPRHYIPAKDNTLRIVDFSLATRHDCAGASLTTFDHRGEDKASLFCEELACLEKHFGAASTKQPRVR